MRRSVVQGYILSAGLFASLCVIAGLTGCATARNGPNGPLLAAPEQPQPQARQVRDEGPTSAQMQELLDRLQSLELNNAQLKKKISDQYMEAVELRAAQLEANKTKPGPATPSPGGEIGASTNQTQPASAPVAADPSTLSRSQLLDALLQQIADSNDPDRVKALIAAALSVATDHKQMDPRLLDQLNPKAREQVARFHQMLAVTFDELASDRTATMTRKDITRKIDEVFGAQPLQIEQFQLCRRVDSFGVYEPFGTTRFLAGRQNRVLIYVELENFKHQPLEDGRYEVRLEQSVELFDATGETTVWRQGPVQLVDVSRNKRRDFFIVYPIDLPARLPAGSYRLKVRIADKHTGSLREQTMHGIQIVADQSLVNER